MTKHLMFDKKYMDALLTGRKRITIRVARSSVPRPGSLVYVHCGGKVIGLAKVTSVIFKPVSALGDEEAREEGFDTREELINALRKHYPSLGSNSLVAVIRFKWIKTFERPLTPEELSWGVKTDPVEVARKALKHCKLTDNERAILELIVREGSIRKAALKLGGLHKRVRIRRVLRNVAKRLKEAGLIE